MPRRPNTVTQSEVTRNIRAVQAANLQVSRVVVRRDGVSIETTPEPLTDDGAGGDHLSSPDMAAPSAG
jgi:hypothetical protein